MERPFLAQSGRSPIALRAAAPHNAQIVGHRAG